MTMALLAFILVLAMLAGLKSRIHGLGLWLLILVTHGIFVHFFGTTMQHLPLLMGGILIPVLLFSGGSFRPPDLPTIILCAFLVILFLSFFINGGDASSFRKIVVYFKPLFVCLLVSGYIRQRRDLDLLAIYIIGAAVLGGLFNIYQQVFGVQLTVNEWDSSLNRAAGLRDDPNDTAMLLVMALPLIYYKIINKPILLIRLCYFACALIVLIGIILTGSRAGFLVTAVVGGTILFHKPKNRRPRLISPPSPRNLLIVVVLSVVAAVFAPSYYWERMSTLVSGKEVGRAQSLYSREFLLKKGLGIWLAHPVFGVGPGNFSEALYGGSTLQEAGQKATVAHNMYIEFLAEIGLLGFTTFLSLCFFSIRGFLRIDKLLLISHSYRYVGYAFALGLFAMLIFGMTLSQGYNSVLWFILGLGSSAHQWLPMEITRTRSAALKSASCQSHA